MKNLKQAGILLILLALPALLFLFLRNSGKNHYSIGRYYPVIDSTSGQVKVGKQIIKGKESIDTLFHTVPDFELTNQDGKQVKGASLKGKVVVADFFFTRCPGMCKKMSSQMTRVQERFQNNPEIQIVSFSVDPENDTVPALRNYADMYDIKTEKWQLLTGDKPQIYRLAKYGYFVTAKENDPTAQNLEDQFVHTDKFVLVDKGGVIRGYYNGTNRKDVDRLITEIDILLQEYEQ
ncbi:SCO family protein [Cytophagaceae bacterium YF14B1]|uniref:SCO family protein n=1 Tax=Xanthocytophaga flava TaxID=3048013 RepID=A0AAE3QGX0_9BACT|nr:SCO family protein [Xanthocytophaga flavus]MDJ1479167.1 SCO family protein [Xanthocytophaga flavus]